jgi:prophage regulatory protein
LLVRNGVMFNNTQRGANMTRTILRLPAVLRERGRSRSAHYLDIQQGLYTRPVSIGARAVGWPENEVAALNAARIAGKGDAEIRVLVAKLEAARKVAS